MVKQVITQGFLLEFCAMKKRINRMDMLEISCSIVRVVHVKHNQMVVLGWDDAYLRYMLLQPPGPLPLV